MITTHFIKILVVTYLIIMMGFYLKNLYFKLNDNFVIFNLNYCEFKVF